jgi:hypothetical protein
MREAALMGTFPVDHVDVAVQGKRYLAVEAFATTGLLLLSFRATAISSATHHRFIRRRFRRLLIRHSFGRLLGATLLLLAALAATLIPTLTTAAASSEQHRHSGRY